MSTTASSPREVAFRRIRRPEAISELNWIELYGLLCVERWITKYTLADRLQEATKLNFEEPIKNYINGLPKEFLYGLFMQEKKPRCFDDEKWQGLFTMLTEMTTKGTTPSNLSKKVQWELNIKLDNEACKFVEWLPWNLMKEEIISHKNIGICKLLAHKYGINLPVSTCALRLTYWKELRENEQSPGDEVGPGQSPNVGMSGTTVNLPSYSGRDAESGGRKHSAEDHMPDSLALVKGPRTSESQLYPTRAISSPPRDPSLPSDIPQGPAKKAGSDGFTLHILHPNEGASPSNQPGPSWNTSNQANEGYKDHNLTSRVIAGIPQQHKEATWSRPTLSSALNSIPNDSRVSGPDHEAAPDASPQLTSADLVPGAESVPNWKNKYQKMKRRNEMYEKYLEMLQPHKEPNHTHIAEIERLEKQIKSLDITITEQNKKAREQEIKIQEYEVKTKEDTEAILVAAAKLKSKSMLVEKQEKQLETAKVMYSYLLSLQDKNQQLEADNLGTRQNYEYSEFVDFGNRPYPLENDLSDTVQSQPSGLRFGPQDKTALPSGEDGAPAAEAQGLASRRGDSGYASGGPSHLFNEWKKLFGQTENQTM